MKRGFTLVELSIVLVIIGLLIGGILVAQSMISTSRVLKVIDEYNQYQSATTLFHSTYKYLPGDMEFGETNCVDGFNGGFCSFALRNNTVDMYSAISNEGYYMFKQLVYAGYLKQELKNFTVSTGPCATGCAELPESKAFKDTYWSASSPSGTAGWFDANYTAPWGATYFGKAANDLPSDSYFVLGKLNSGSFSEGLSMPTVLAIDSKMDDGYRNNGKVRMGYNGNSDPTPTAPYPTSATDNAVLFIKFDIY